MIKIVISILFCFLLASCSLKDDALSLNRKVLNYLQKLEAYPLISQISFENGNITLKRQAFKSHPSHFFGDVRNLMNERLPYDEDEYFDLSNNIKKCRKEEYIQDYVEALDHFLEFLKTTWKIEQYLKKRLNIQQRRFLNTSKIHVYSLSNEGKRFLENTKFDFSVEFASMKTIKRLLNFLEKSDLRILPFEQKSQENEDKKEDKKKDKKKKRKNWVRRTGKRWF